MPRRNTPAKLKKLARDSKIARLKQLKTIADMLAVQVPKALAGSRMTAKLVMRLLDRKGKLTGAEAPVKLDAKANKPAETVNVLAIMFTTVPRSALPDHPSHPGIDVCVTDQDAAAALSGPPASHDLPLGAVVGASDPTIASPGAPCATRVAVPGPVVFPESDTGRHGRCRTGPPGRDYHGSQYLAIRWFRRCFGGTLSTNPVFTAM